ncbi:MAG: hypothetical protein CM1200mP41_04830 [Gammaproteobacteria bacterium]|nr:MAG: hypothetical protein CM1200mP41_04830 [Gammaproteobacteria bacterium]
MQLSNLVHHLLINVQGARRIYQDHVGPHTSPVCQARCDRYRLFPFARETSHSASSANLANCSIAAGR